MSNIIKVKDSNGNWIGIPALQGEPGITPHIGENGNWFIGEEDTGVKANIDLTPYATTEEVNQAINAIDIPANTSDLTNDSGFITKAVDNLDNYYKKTEVDTAISEIKIPTKVSELTNDSGFLTNTVDNLVNYYKKSETYTQAEVNNLINSITTLNIEVVPTLPTSNISSTTIYLKGSEAAGTNDYEEWLYVNGGWELIGTTAIDLSPYATKTYVGEQIAGVTKSSLGLGNVENKSSATIRGELTSANVTTALGYTPAKDDHTHNYLPLSGGTLSGDLNFSSTNNIAWNQGTIQQKIAIGDSTEKTDATFKLQESSDGGTTFVDLLKVTGEGKVQATSFEGDGASLTSLKEGNLTWGNKAIKGGVSPIGMALSEEHSGNKAAFINGNAITIEYSTDGGTTYTDSGISAINKSALFTRSFDIPVGGSTSMTADNYSKLKTRITLTAQDGTNGYIYTDIKKILVDVSSAVSINMLIETMRGDSTSWVTYGTYSINGWSGWNDIPLIIKLGGGASQKDRPWKVRFTLSLSGSNTSYPTTKAVRAFRIFGENSWTVPSTFGKTGHMYSYDMEQNVVFPKKVNATTFAGSGAELTALNASNISSGTVPAARLPKASASAIGGIKVGSGLSIDANGVLSAASGSGVTSLSLSVATSAWAADTTYTGYGFKATVTATGVTANSVLLVGLTNTATSAQEEASAAAGIQCKGQAANQIILYAKTKPTIALPISVAILG